MRNNWTSSNHSWSICLIRLTTSEERMADMIHVVLFSSLKIIGAIVKFYEHPTACSIMKRCKLKQEVCWNIFFFSAKPNLFLFSFSKVYKKNSYCILKGITDWFIGTDLLPNKHFPIIFESVNGSCESSNFSWHNKEEIKLVIHYIQKILNRSWNGNEVSHSNIGIISPYKAQCEKIQEKLRDNAWDKITVGTAETFQGQEREIIIISTVRTGVEKEKDLGFITDIRVRKTVGETFYCPFKSKFYLKCVKTI